MREIPSSYDRNPRNKCAVPSSSSVQAKNKHELVKVDHRARARSTECVYSQQIKGNGIASSKVSGANEWHGVPFTSDGNRLVFTRRLHRHYKSVQGVVSPLRDNTVSFSVVYSSEIQMRSNPREFDVDIQ